MSQDTIAALEELASGKAAPTPVPAPVPARPSSVITQPTDLPQYMPNPMPPPPAPLTPRERLDQSAKRLRFSLGLCIAVVGLLVVTLVAGALALITTHTLKKNPLEVVKKIETKGVAANYAKYFSSNGKGKVTFTGDVDAQTVTTDNLTVLGDTSTASLGGAKFVAKGMTAPQRVTAGNPGTLTSAGGLSATMIMVGSKAPKNTSIIGGDFTANDFFGGNVLAGGKLSLALNEQQVFTLDGSDNSLTIVGDIPKSAVVVTG